MSKLKHRCYDAALKKAIVELNKEGKSVKYLSGNYSVSESAIYRWKRSMDSVGDESTSKGESLKSIDIEVSMTLIIKK